jgi:hypothetical protein
VTPLFSSCWYLKINFVCFFSFPFLLFVSSGVWAQGLELAWKEFDHVSHDLSPFCFSYFSNRFSSFMPTLALIYSLCFPHSWDYSHGPPCLSCLLRWESPLIFLMLALG